MNPNNQNFESMSVSFKIIYPEKLFNSFFKKILTVIFVLLSIIPGIMAQDAAYIRPSWWVGVSGGINTNLYHGGTQMVNSELSFPFVFQNKIGYGPFAFTTIEFRPPGAKTGFMLNVGYDSRSGIFSETFKTRLAYLTVEPSIRFNPTASPFYLFWGPRIAFTADPRFRYTPNPDAAEITGDFNKMKDFVVSMQIGFGYDLLVSPKNTRNQLIISPFASFHPYFGQNPRTIEGWNLTTIRAGIALKFGKSRIAPHIEKIEIPVAISTKSGEQDLVSDVKSPDQDSKVGVALPLKDYVFFNSISTVVNNYKDLNSSITGKESKNDLVESQRIMNLSDTTVKRLILKDNFINILGELMVKYPSNSITLTGKSGTNMKDGYQLAQLFKSFLIEVYHLDEKRIDVKGRKTLKSKIQRNNRIQEIGLLQFGNSQVLFESNSRNLQNEFRGGNGLPLKSLKMNTARKADALSHITFKTEGAKETFSSWTLEIRDEQGNPKSFGPFNKDLVSIPGKSILGNRTFGKYEITMIGKLQNGTVVKKDTVANLVILTPPANSNLLRYSILYEYNNSKSIQVYRDYLTRVVVPHIPKNGTVVIHGHSENVTNKDYQLKMYLKQANDTKSLIEQALVQCGRNDVQIEDYAMGDDMVIAPFQTNNQANSLTRTIILDILPEK